MVEQGTSLPTAGNMDYYYDGLFFNDSGLAELENVTLGNGSLGEESEEYNWSILFLAPVVVFGVGGNLLVIMAISLEKRLQNVTNYFLLSLALTDLLVSLIVMPFSIINEFTGQWLFGLLMCDLFVTSDVLMCTSSILHLCTISLERYVAIRYPLWAKNKSKRVVLVKIVLVWTISIAITSPITVLGLVESRNVLKDSHCVLSNQHFIIYGSVFAFFIPLVIMIVMYALTVRMLNKQARLCSTGSQTEGMPMIRRSTSRRHWKSYRQQRDKLSASQSFPLTQSSGPSGEITDIPEHPSIFKRNTLPLLRHGRDPQSRVGGGLSNKRTFCFRNGDVSSGVSASGSAGSGGGSGGSASESGESPSHPGCCNVLPPKRSEPLRLKNLVRKHHVAIKAANILLMRKEIVRKESNSVQTEQKASKVLGVVFLIFVVCWAPFFIINILTVLCKESTIDATLVTVFVWLGYVSSTLNPIIYTVFNNVFKRTFIKLLRCRYSTLHTGRRSTAHSSQRNGLLACNTLCASGHSASLDDSNC